MTVNNNAAHDRCCSEDHQSEAVQTPAAAGHKEEVISVAISSLDNLGILASALCLVHCLAMPFIIAFLPLLGLQFLETHESHLIIASFIWIFALFAIVPGYLKHKKREVLLGMIFGLGLVTFAVAAGHQVFGEKGELICLTVGNLTLVAVHWKNRGLCKCEH